MLLADIDWGAWQADDVATLLFVIDGAGGRALLIRKKRGLGAGKINAPGGRLEPNESPLACAVRETQEEIGVTPLAPQKVGELRFQFVVREGEGGALVPGYKLHAHVYRAAAWEGEPIETDEATPHWFPLDALPFDEMWADDRLWIPMMLAGRAFDARFVFEDERMLDHRFD